MEKTNKYYGIIENLVRQHKKFPGYEPILDDIIDDVYSHSEVIINSINNESVIKAYLEKVIATSIITVPKKLNFRNTLQNNRQVNTELIDKMINGPKPSPEVNIVNSVQNVSQEQARSQENFIDDNNYSTPVNDDITAKQDEDVKDKPLSFVDEMCENPVDEISIDTTDNLYEAQPFENSALTEIDDVQAVNESLIEPDNDAQEVEQLAQPLDMDTTIDDAENNYLPDEQDFQVEDLEIISDEDDLSTNITSQEQLEENTVEKSSFEMSLSDNTEEDENANLNSLDEVPDVVIPESNDTVLADDNYSVENQEIIESSELDNKDSEIIDYSEPSESLVAEAPVGDDTVLEVNNDTDKPIEQDIEVLDEPSFDMEPESIEMNDGLDLTIEDSADEGFLEVDNDDTTFELEQDSILPIDSGSIEVDELEEISDSDESLGDTTQSDAGIVDYSVFNYVPNSGSDDDLDIDGITKELLDLNHKRPELNIIKVYELKYKENLSLSDIALKLEMSENSVLEALSEIIAIV